ncbi:MAG TPA: hypothetical protein PKD90_08810 [Phnomibacter sp.]|nr:hypothetical protein [Phnomibacter sp.]
MGYFKRNDPRAYDKELYDRVFKRYAKIYPEAKDPDFEPNYSGHDYDWDEIWEEEYQKRQDELANTPYGPEPPPPKPKKDTTKKEKKKKEIKKKKEEEDDIILLDDDTTDPVGKCSKPPEDAATKQCSFDGLMIDLGGKNIISLDLKKDYLKPFEVLVGKESRAGTLAIMLQHNNTGPCNSHSKHVFFVTGNPDCYKDVSKNDTQLDVKFFSSLPNIVPLLSPLVLPRYNDVMLKHTPEKVKVLIAKCGRTAEVELKIYPDFETSVEFGFGADKKRIKDNVKDVLDTIVDAGHSKTTKSLTFKHSFNGNTVEYGAAAEKVYKNSFEVFKAILRVMQFCEKYLGGVVVVDLLMPSISIKGSWKYEQTKDYEVKPTGKLTAAADPLLGLELKVDLLKAGVAAFGVPPKVTEIPKKIKDWSGGRAEVALDFHVYVNGKVSFEISKQFGGKKDLNIQPKISMAMGAKVSAKGEVNLLIKVSAEASAHASAGFSLSAKIAEVYMPKGSIELEFDGLKLQLMARYEAGIGWFKTAGEVQGEYVFIESQRLGGFDFNLND